MSCTDYEKLIYTFQELDAVDQGKVKGHLETCLNCKQLFNDVHQFSLVVKQVGLETQNENSTDITGKVMDVIDGKNEETWSTRINAWFDLSVSRYALAAISCGILILFFVQIMVPELKSGRIKGPISNVQGAIIKSEDFRKVFTRSKERKSLFDECKNVLSQQVDENCVKEKLSKFNF